MTANLPTGTALERARLAMQRSLEDSERVSRLYEQAEIDNDYAKADAAAIEVREAAAEYLHTALHNVLMSTDGEYVQWWLARSLRAGQ